jgi:hypothetical protein
LGPGRDGGSRVTVTSADATTAAQTNQLRFNLGISGRPRAARQLEILALRCLEMADPVSAGELPFIDTVDAIYDAALRSGLVREVGDDIVQRTMAAAFANARGPT